MGNKEETKLNKLSEILESLKDKVSVCNNRDFSLDIVDFTDTITNIDNKNLDRFQNKKLTDIRTEYYLTIHQLEDKCLCNPKIEEKTKGFNMMMRDRARNL